MSKPDYDTSLARMAGNIAGGWVDANMLICRGPDLYRRLDPRLAGELAEAAVLLARAIVAEVKRTAPFEGTHVAATWIGKTVVELGVDDRSSPHTTGEKS